MLLEMLTYTRAHLGAGEAAFIKAFIEPTGATPDAFGNYHLTIGSNSTTLFSAHTDSVHSNRAPMKQTVLTDNRFAWKEDGLCLGADDATGCYILLKLIENKTPGHYIFHRGEERGGLGSKWLSQHQPELLKQFQRAIAFDRKGYDNVITHQAFSRCCSDAFAESLANQLGYTVDDTGIFTDTANYTHLIPECTNLSVGYFNEHSKNEYQDLLFAERLVEKCLGINWETLPTERDPNQYDDYYSSRTDDLYNWVYAHPQDAADLLWQFGIYSALEAEDALNYSHGYNQ